MNEKKEIDVGEFYGMIHDVFNYCKRDAKDEMRHYMQEYGLTKNITFCEAGGSGCRAEAMAQLGAKVYYIDLSNEHIERRKNVNGLTAIHGSIIDSQPIKDCDLVFSLGVIHHTEYPAAALLNISKWIKQGGLLHLSFYNGETDYFFWVKTMRSLMPKDVSFNELYPLIPYVNIDHLFVPTMNLGTPDIVLHDLDKLGFTVKKKYDGFLYRILAQKTRETDAKISDLLYKPDLALSLSRDAKIKIILEIFNQKFRGKKRNPIKKLVTKIMKLGG